MDPRPPLDRLVDGQLLHQIVKLCWWAYPRRWAAGPLGRPRERQQQPRQQQHQQHQQQMMICLLYTTDADDEKRGVDLGGRRNIKKK